MGSNDDDAPPPLALPLLRVRPASPPPSPLQTFATVPFKWEEKPGVPRLPSPAAVTQQPIKCLELPPCRIILPLTPSPTSVLDGPRALGRPKFSSFRFLRYHPETGSPDGDADYIETFLNGGVPKALKGTAGKKKGGRDHGGGGGSFRFSSPSNSSWESDESFPDDNNNKPMRTSRPRHLLVSFLFALFNSSGFQLLLLFRLPVTLKFCISVWT